jgi:hypothetical protein
MLGGHLVQLLGEVLATGGVAPAVDLGADGRGQPRARQRDRAGAKVGGQAWGLRTDPSRA